MRDKAAAAEAGGAVLRGARSPVAAQLDVQVQSVGRRDPETFVVAGMSQRVAAWRRPPQVSHVRALQKKYPHIYYGYLVASFP